MRYQCPRCLLEFNRMGHYQKHISKKNKCSPNSQEQNGIVPCDSNVIKLEHQFDCDFCEKSYSDLHNLTKHQERSCRQNEVSIMRELSKEIQEVKNILNQTQLQLTQYQNHPVNKVNNAYPQTQNINTQNINNTQNNDKSINNSFNTSNNMFLLNNYNETKYDHITTPEVIKYMKNCMTALPKVIERIHYDPEKPENHNAYISNKKTKNAHYLKNGSWVTMDGDELAETMMTDYHYKLFHTMSENPRVEEEYPEIKDVYDRYYNVTSGHDDQIREEIVTLMYNQREMCKRTYENLTKLTDKRNENKHNFI